jgi:hypothetical protein
MLDHAPLDDEPETEEERHAVAEAHADQASALILKLARTNTDDRYMALPAETGPALAPDRLSVWPVEGGRYGLDATYHGATGFERAEAQRQRLEAANLPASVRQEVGDDWTLRLGPLTHSAAWTAIEAFLGSSGTRIG